MTSRLPLRYSVLVGDDDAAVRGAVVEVLADRPVQVLTATSGSEALTILVSHQIDFTILDVEMPGMTGIEVLNRYLRGAFIAPAQGQGARLRPRRTLPAIFMSGNRDGDIRQACELLGMTFLPKPFAAMDMRRAVDEVLQHLAL